MHDNIPEEFKSYIQFVCWKLEQTDTGAQTKIPYNPKTNRKASVNDRSSYCSFPEAVKGKLSGSFTDIGFVITKQDPLACIDFDAVRDDDGNIIHDPEVAARQLKVLGAMDSYTEYSPSGYGLHTWVKGAVPHGRKRAHMEIYSSGRFMTMTGNIYHNAPIMERNTVLNTLWAELGNKDKPDIDYFAGDLEEILNDVQVLGKAHNASNGDLFADLYAGNWQNHYKSQSEGDFALIDLITFYTHNRYQIMRIFRNSGLGQRDKARRDDYVGNMINKSFDRTLKPIDLSGIHDQMNAGISAVLTGNAVAVGREPIAASALPGPGQYDLTPQAVPAAPPRLAIAPPSAPPPSDPPSATLDGYPLDTWQRNLPPGLVGRISNFIYQQAPRPVNEIALAGALGLMAGIVGRSFNVSGTGLNHYIILTAKSGSGKEAIAAGIGKLISSVSLKITDGVELNTMAEFIGPAEVSSGQALLKYISGRKKTPCFVSIIGEVGLKLRQLSDEHANGAELMLKRVLLDLYHKSGKKDTLQPSIYSDKTNNTEMVRSPAFSLIGETVPEEFYKSLSEAMITNGLLSRFLCINYDGPRVNYNSGHELVSPSPELVKELSELGVLAHHHMNSHTPQDIGRTDDAILLLDELGFYCDKKVNDTQKTTLRELWNRGHLKTWKLAGLLAVGLNPSNPIIDRLMVEWAFSLVATDILRIVEKFQSGEIEEKIPSDNLYQTAIQKALVHYFMTDAHNLEGYLVPPDLHAAKIIPYSYLQRKLISNNPFKKAKPTGTIQLQNSLKTLTEMGVLQEMGGKDKEKFNTTQRCYVVKMIKWLFPD